jgi:hypothetical protein
MNVNAGLTKGGIIVPGQFLWLLVARVGSIMPSTRRARGYGRILAELPDALV